MKVEMHWCNHLISYASRKDGFDNNASGLASHNTESEASAVVDQLNCLHMLQLGRVKRKKRGVKTSLRKSVAMFEILPLENSLSYQAKTLDNADRVFIY